MQELPTPYQEYIHQSKYARWREDLGRRENWEETVDRFIEQIERQTGHLGSDLSPEESEELRQAILNLEILPSMRAFMTAGKALERDNVAGYNCAYVAINRQHVFDEILYILCCGTGVGFSVERQFIKQLPEIPDEVFPTDTTIKVRDSKIGWATAFRELISLLYAGNIPSWDMSAVRPEGTPLKTFGGRASGPGPLEELFHYTIEVFRQAVGRKLTSEECHGIVCKIGDVVVVGGVRRSALLSLFNPSDERMLNAKNGRWYDDPMREHYALANNSAAYTEKPDMERFLDKWTTLVSSKSGEPGIFNREAAKVKCRSIGRDDTPEFGVNPCVTADTWVMTDSGPKTVLDLIGESFNAVVDGSVYTSGGFWKTGIKEVLSLVTQEGYQLRLTSNHRVMTPKGWVEAETLRPGDKIKLNNHRAFEGWPGIGSFNEGWLLGELIGDGNFSGTQAQVKFWGESQSLMLDRAVELIHTTVGGRSDLVGHTHANYSVASSKNLADLASQYGITNGIKAVSEEVERASSAFQRGFLKGLFDADGSVQGTQQKGISVRLSQSNIGNLRAVQRMLLRLGIQSAIYENRRGAGVRILPDGKGGQSEFWCQAQHELVITNDNLFVYRDRVGFEEPAKSELLDLLLSQYKRTPNRGNFEVRVKEIFTDGLEAVYDCTVPDIHAFDANGLYVHNCGEIILRDRQFCNLTEVVIRSDDTAENLARKVRLATILGTIQASFTDFRYLSKQWKKNCDEEALLGVSLDGVQDSPLTSFRADPLELGFLLQTLNYVARQTNRDWADRLGIERSAAITTAKPSGNSSQLVCSGSGMHPWYGKFLIRRTRGNKSDPVSQVVQISGVHTEDEIRHTDTTSVHSWAMKAPDTAVTRNDMTALDQLKHWIIYAESWTDHNPSVTIYVREHEWLEVGAFVFKHWDRMCGITFLPFSDHIYQQAPYEEVSEEKYLQYVSENPTEIQWDLLGELETHDLTDGAKELACMSGSCVV